MPVEITQFCQAKQAAAFSRRHNIPLRKAMRKLLGHNVWPERFRRNFGLLGAAEQARLLDLPIFIAGCGGLGGEIAALLAHMGAGKICLCDYDIFEESNLNRQRFCDEESLGKAKAEVAATALRKLASWGEYRPLIQKLEPANLPELLEGSEIVIDCLDSIPARQMLEDATKAKGLAWLHGSVLENEGFACLEAAASGALRRQYKPDCVASGAGSVLAHVVAGTASLMAALFRRWLADSTTSSPLVHFDFSVPELQLFELP